MLLIGGALARWREGKSYRRPKLRPCLLGRAVFFAPPVPASRCSAYRRFCASLMRLRAAALNFFPGGLPDRFPAEAAPESIPRSATTARSIAARSFSNSRMMLSIPSIRVSSASKHYRAELYHGGVSATSSPQTGQSGTHSERRQRRRPGRPPAKKKGRMGARIGEAARKRWQQTSR
jgi:hypothetical protein